MVAIAALVAGGTLEFTRIAVGDGELKDGQVPGTMTKLNNPLFDVTINKVYSDSVSQATIQGVFSNSQVATGFYYRELGLFAKDPATGSEILYAYGNAGEDAEWITPAGESSIIEKEIHIVVLIGNATNVTATLNSGIYAIKKETEAALALKADLDNTAEKGGRVLATQMRFDADQTLYVDAAAAEGGDGSQAKPFKTIQAAINSRYKGAPVIYIRIKAGTYNENISVPRSPGTTWRFIREGTGTVAINTALIDNCTYILFDNLTFNGPATDNSTIIYVANTASANLNAVTVNGASNATSINFSTSRGIIRNSVFNNSGLAIAATDGAYLDLKGNSGTGNIRALQADGSIIISDWYIPQATTPYEKVNGGVINLEGGTSSFPSNYSQMYSLGDFTDAGTLKTAILTEFRKLGIGESRDCWFANNISAGFGPFGSGQRMQCKIIKSTDSGSGYGTIIFYSHHNAPAGFMQVQDGAFATAAPVKFITGSDIATYDNYGLVRVADDTDVLSDDNDEAAITPAVYHDVSDFRHKSTAYKVGDKVECMFNFELFLECTQGGTTGSGALDTRNVTHGQVITDGTVKWTVRTHIKSVNNIVADASGNVSIDTVTNATKATQDAKGQQIDTTYIKGVTASNATLTVTKGNGTTSSVTINNVAHATSSDSATNATNAQNATNATNAQNSAKATQDSSGQQINTTYVKGVTVSNATLTVTKGNGSNSSVTINNVANANNVSVAQKFRFEIGGSSAVYRIFARTSLDAGASHGNSTFLITCTGNYGSNILGSYIVNISNRGGARMYVRELIPDGSNSTTFGYYISGSYIYFGFSNSSFSGECSVTPLNISSNSGHETGNYKNDSTIPSGWTPVTIEKLAPITSPAFSGTPTAPTPGTTDNGTRIATTAFVQSLIGTKKTVSFASGSVNVNGTYTIPLPSGFTREQCRYAIWTRFHNYDDAGGAHEITASVNQSTGVITGKTNRKGSIGVIELEYLVIAAK